MDVLIKCNTDKTTDTFHLNSFLLHPEDGVHLFLVHAHTCGHASLPYREALSVQEASSPLARIIIAGTLVLNGNM